MSDATKALEDLKGAHTKMAEEIKALETKITEETKARRPELKKGQLWKHLDGSVYLGRGMANQGVDLVQVSALDDMESRIGNNWSEGRGFSNSPEDFTYLGVASDLLTIKEPK